MARWLLYVMNHRWDVKPICDMVPIYLGRFYDGGQRQTHHWYGFETRQDGLRFAAQLALASPSELPHGTELRSLTYDPTGKTVPDWAGGKLNTRDGTNHTGSVLLRADGCDSVGGMAELTQIEEATVAAIQPKIAHLEPENRVSVLIGILAWATEQAGLSVDEVLDRVAARCAPAVQAGN